MSYLAIMMFLLFFAAILGFTALALAASGIFAHRRLSGGACKPSRTSTLGSNP